MDKEDLKIYAEVCNKIVILRGYLGEVLNHDHQYIKAREMINDCIELMAKRADLPPVKLYTKNI